MAVKESVPIVYTLELEVKTPTHIGTGETIAGNAFVFDEGGGRAYHPDIKGYLRDHPDRAKAEQVASAIEDRQPLATILDPIGQYSRYALDNWVDESELGASMVNEAMKTGTDEPYIPGSSIKGYVRTALAYQALVADDQRVLPKSEAVEAVFKLGSYETDDSIQNGFGFQRDILRCLTIRDTEPVDPHDTLALTKVDIHNGPGEMDDLETTYAECLKPRTTLQTELLVDTELLEELINEHGYGQKVRAIFGRPRRPEDVRETLESALSTFGEALMEHERSLTENIDGVGSFYDEHGDNGANARLGRWTGYYSKTLLMALDPADQVLVQASSKNDYPKHDIESCSSPLKPDYGRGEQTLQCSSCSASGIDPLSEAVSDTPFPKSRSVAVRDDSDVIPMGWLSAELQEAT